VTKAGDGLQVVALNGDNTSMVSSMATTDHLLLTVAQIFPLLKKQHYL
jgi:hypothetical protein